MKAYCTLIGCTALVLPLPSLETRMTRADELHPSSLIAPARCGGGSSTTQESSSCALLEENGR